MCIRPIGENGKYNGNGIIRNDQIRFCNNNTVQIICIINVKSGNIYFFWNPYQESPTNPIFCVVSFLDPQVQFLLKGLYQIKPLHNIIVSTAYSKSQRP